jgi:periplasmic protein CpxP/Spy
MKKLALTLAIGMLSLGAVFAQDGKKDKVKTEMDASRKQQAKKSPEERAAFMTEKMTRELNLTSAQSAKVKEAALRKNTQMRAVKEKHGENREAMKADMKTVRTTWQNDLKGILTAEQMTKYQAMKAERKGRDGGKHQGKKGDYKHKK